MAMSEGKISRDDGIGVTASDRRRKFFFTIDQVVCISGYHDVGNEYCDPEPYNIVIFLHGMKDEILLFFATHEEAEKEFNRLTKLVGEIKQRLVDRLGA